MKSLFKLLIVFLIVTNFSALYAPAYAVYTSGQSYWSTNNYIQYIAGDAPIIFIAPHDGQLNPTTITDRTCVTPTGQSFECVKWGGDTNSLAYAQKTLIKIHQLTGKRPHIIINHLERNKLDANRSLRDAAYPHVSTMPTNPNQGQLAWKEFHDFIRAAKTQIVATYGAGHVFDIHTHGDSSSKIIQLGTRLSISDLSRSDAELNTPTFVNQSTMKRLSQTHGNTLSGITRGPMSLGALLQASNIRAYPNNNYPPYAITDDDPNDGSNPIFRTGVYNVIEHGSLNSGTINATQIETHFSFINSTVIDGYSTKLANALVTFMKASYELNNTLEPMPTPTLDSTPTIAFTSIQPYNLLSNWLRTINPNYINSLEWTDQWKN